MKSSTILYALLCLALSGFPAMAEEHFANVNAGNVLTGVSASVNKGWDSGYNSFDVYFRAPLQYFVLDRLALGGTINVSSYMSSLTASTQTSLGVGPAATYYFLLQDKLGYYASESVTYGHSFYFDSNDVVSLTAAGVNYFFTPSAAFGPVLDYTHVFSNGSDINGLSLAFAFTTYL